MRTGRRRIGGRVVRPMDWEYSLVTTGAIVQSTKAAAYVVTPTELNAEYTDPTLMASRLVSSCQFAAASAANSVFVVGLIAWDDINNTAPAGAECPGPITNGNLDWILRQVHTQPNGGAASSFIDAGDHTIVSKARRRLGSSRGVLVVFETNAQASMSGAIADVRCLVKE